MIIPTNIINIIINYSKPLTIDCLSNNRKIFYGICINEDCNKSSNFCSMCWRHFNIIYDMSSYVSNIHTPLEGLQEKIVKYFLVRRVITTINFRDLKDYNTHFYVFLIKLQNYCEQIEPLDISNSISYKKLFLLSHILTKFLI